MNDQELFWQKTYAEKYIKKNYTFDDNKGAKAWKKMLSKCNKDDLNILECGSNIGRNIRQIKKSFPKSTCSVIEINNEALEICKFNNDIEKSFCGSLFDCDFDKNQFDLVFTMGVLIHTAPENLLSAMTKIKSWSSKYILFGEYFNRTPCSIEYQGQKNQLFKRDFGKFFIENFEAKCIDYGFLWSHEYETAGFDDCTWWLFDIQS